MATKKTTKFDFEASLKELESIVDTIERGGLSLEESLKLFSQGVMLTKNCQQAIKAAEQKVKILTGEDLTEFKLGCGCMDEDQGADENE
ncbi:MAG TPA: exodeoxyribonuclease VII small subunit [Coxiellaceae bacterium]|nr:MAG: exodeoxyribonuclease VII small subunit [Gammaproteobacteria bacterium RBG_16_37_9]HBC71463.1 exodeoxyribonuclease VII small subunit [Coxiellaceae bacterium]HBY55755.1 exodeoxyribonuclease VII small subunit [Coxiellaceae bacterium]